MPSATQMAATLAQSKRLDAQALAKLAESEAAEKKGHGAQAMKLCEKALALAAEAELLRQKYERMEYQLVGLIAA